VILEELVKFATGGFEGKVKFKFFGFDVV